MGRMVQRKGLREIAEISKYVDIPIIMAGMGAKQVGDTIFAQDCTIKGKNLKYIGEVGVKERGKLMSEAQAVLCPTQYIEPFCGVNVEAQLCGTPVITPDYGAFVETVEDGMTGFRCKNLKDYVEAVEKVKKLDTGYIMFRAASKYSLEVVANQYQDYFDRLYTLWNKGWYEI
jgi:glycosyltransferase involved in cell wall biosynthesis